MFLLCGARPYVSIVWRSAICFYCVCGPYVFIGVCYESYHMFSLTMEPSAGHVIKILEVHFGYQVGIKKLLKTNKYEILVRRGGSLAGSMPLGPNSSLVTT